MGSCGQVRAVESRVKVEGQRMETCFRREVRQRARAVEYVVGRQLLVFRRQQRTLVCMVNGVIEEMLNLDMEPKPDTVALKL